MLERTCCRSHAYCDAYCQDLTSPSRNAGNYMFSERVNISSQFQFTPIRVESGFLLAGVRLSVHLSVAREADALAREPAIYGCITRSSFTSRWREFRSCRSVERKQPLNVHSEAWPFVPRMDECLASCVARHATTREARFIGSACRSRTCPGLSCVRDDRSRQLPCSKRVAGVDLIMKSAATGKAELQEREPWRP